MSYSEQLKDPRWQRKRLEILQRDGFACRNCGDKEKELHVHHIVYIKGMAPWEYDQSLLTLCTDCHMERQRAQNELLLCTQKFNVAQLYALASFIASFFDLKMNSDNETGGTGE